MAESTPETNVKTMPSTAKRGRGRPAVDDPTAPSKTAEPGEPPFFKLVRDVPEEDWGVRSFIYVYVTEPLCNLKQGGGKSYLVRFSKPVDLQQLMEDYGSFQGYMTLNRRKAGADAGDLIDRFDFSIYNPKYPPKIPRSVWLNDPRNERWAALLPKDEPQPAATGDAGKMLELLFNMQDRMAERMDRSNPGEMPQATDQLTALVNAASTMAAAMKPTTPAAPAADPFALAQQIITMQTTNPMVDRLGKQVDSLTAMLNAEREARAKVEKDTLDQKIAALEEKLSKPNAAASGDWLDQLEKLSERKERIAKALGIADAAETVTRSKLPWWAEWGERMVPHLAPMVAPLLARAFTPAPQPMRPNFGSVPPNPPPIDVRPQPGAAGVQQQPAQQMQQPGQSVELSDDPMQLAINVTPSLIQHLKDGMSGADFAEWFNNGFPKRLEQLQNISVPAMPGQSGAPVILAFYKMAGLHMPTPGGPVGVWPLILDTVTEAEFAEFVQEFCEWKPPSDETNIPAGVSDAAPESDETERIEL